MTKAYIPSDSTAGQTAAASLFFRTPCCESKFIISYSYEGSAYLQEQVVEGFECDSCDNMWYADGSPSLIHSTEENEDGWKPAFMF